MTTQPKKDLRPIRSPRGVPLFGHTPRIPRTNRVHRRTVQAVPGGALRRGDRRHRDGGWAQYTLARGNAPTPLPRNLPLEQAAIIPEGPTSNHLGKQIDKGVTMATETQATAVPQVAIVTATGETDATTVRPPQLPSARLEHRGAGVLTHSPWAGWYYETDPDR